MKINGRVLWNFMAWDKPFGLVGSITSREGVKEVVMKIGILFPRGLGESTYIRADNAPPSSAFISCKCFVHKHSLAPASTVAG